MEVRRVRPAGGVRLAAGHRDDAPEAHLVLLAASTPEGDMLVNLGPGQSGWATQLVSDRHVLGVRLVEQLWTPPTPPPGDLLGGPRGEVPGGQGGCRGAGGPTTGTEGATGPTTLAGAASPETKPPRPAIEPAALQAVGTSGSAAWVETPTPPSSLAALLPGTHYLGGSRCPHPMTCGLNTKCGCRDTKEWAGLDTLTRRPGQQHHQPAANPPSVQAETMD